MLKKEIVRHVANRIPAVLFREVTHLAKEDVVSVADADAAVLSDRAPRWSIMGQCMLYYLGADDAGLGPFLEKFAPSINAW